MSTSKVIPSHKHLESKETEETSHKNTMKNTDNLDSIILNLSQLEGNEKKEKYSNEYSNI